MSLMVSSVTEYKHVFPSQSFSMLDFNASLSLFLMALFMASISAFKASFFIDLSFWCNFVLINSHGSAASCFWMAWDINPDTLEFLQSELLFVFFMCVVFLIFCKGTVRFVRRKMCYTYKNCYLCFCYENNRELTKLSWPSAIRGLLSCYAPDKGWIWGYVRIS